MPKKTLSNPNLTNNSMAIRDLTIAPLDQTFP